MLFPYYGELPRRSRYNLRLDGLPFPHGGAGGRVIEEWSFGV